MIVANSNQFLNLKATLDGIATDDAVDEKIYAKYYKVERTSDAYVDFMETAATGYAAELAEGEEPPDIEFHNGPPYRLRIRKFACKFKVAEEALEDGKESEYIDPAKRVKRVMVKTREIDAANIFNRATDANYPFADGQPLASTAHTLPGGGTFSNRLAVGMTPGRGALVTIYGNVLMLPGHDGNVGESLRVVKVIGYPTQFGIWDEVLMTDKQPESGNNAINTAIRNSVGMKPVFVPIPWLTSTSLWGAITDCEDGFVFIIRKKDTPNTYVGEGNDVVIHKIKGRWERGCKDPGRAFYLGNT